MKAVSLFARVLVGSMLAAGCASSIEDAPSVGAFEGALSLSECAAQRDACFSKNPILGLLTCPAQYTQCVATAEDGLPGQVASAVSEVTECRQAARACLAEATSPVRAAACAEDEAECVAAVLDVDLPDVVEDTAACVDRAADCVNASETAADLRECADGLRACAVEVVQSALPEPVVEVITDITECARARDACVRSAESATALPQCTAAQAQCVASSLGVKLPDVPISEVVGCTDRAARCALDASSPGDVAECASGLASCAADVIESIDAPEALSCEQKWTACMARNPFDFLRCASELAGCRDN